MNVRALLVVFGLGLAACGVTLAQTTGDLEGFVTDDEGQALPGVTAVAVSPSLQGSKVAVTDASGLFRIPLLPPGTYAVRFDLSGFSPREQEGVLVGLGRTVTLRVDMQSAFAGEVNVAGEPPVIDVSSTEVGTNFTPGMFLSLPLERDYTSVVRVAPGTSTDGAGTTVYGSSGAENAYYIDGLNTTEIYLGASSKQLNFEFIQELQVKAGAYKAEYGRSTGGVVNVITRSGGNELHGDVFAYYFDDGLQGSLDPEVERFREAYGGSFVEAGFTESDYGFDLGGAFLRDRLWFFVAYDRVDNSVDKQVSKDFSPYGGPTLGTVYDTTTARDLWSTKLTWRLTDNHSLVASAFGDPTTEEGPLNVAFSGLNGEESTFMGTYEHGGSDGLLRWEGVLGSRVVANVQAARHTDRTVGHGPGSSIPRVTDYTTALFAATGVPSVTGGLGAYTNREYVRDSYRADLSYFATGGAGDHELKGGAEQERLEADYLTHNSGGRSYSIRCARGHLTPDGCEPGWSYYLHGLLLTGVPPGGVADPSLPDYVTDEFLSRPKTTNTAAYLQDGWRVLPTLTLNLGLRWERQQIYDGDRNLQIDIDDEWAPRLGLVWDFLGDGRSRAYASWGVFYETIPMLMGARAFSPYPRATVYNTDPESLACSPPLPCTLYSPGTEPVDPGGVKGQYLEEAIVGAEMEVAADLTVGVRLIRRDLARVVEDASAGDGSFYIGNPGRGRLTSTLDETSTWVFPAQKPERTFEGIELVARKRFANRWQLLATYLLSKMDGNYDGTYQASTGQLSPNLNSAYDYAEFQVNNDGPLSSDRRHQLKVAATYVFPFRLDVGLAAYYRSGTPVTAMGYDANYFNWEYYLSRRGRWDRTDSEYEADLHLGYPFKIRDVELNLLLDVFNLLDRQGETGRDMRYDLDQVLDVIDYDTGEALSPIPDGTPCTAVVAPENAASCNAGFNTANRWQAPRSVRVGLRLTF